MPMLYAQNNLTVQTDRKENVMSYKKLAGLALILTLAACSSTVELPPPSSDSSEQSEATVAPVVQEAGTDQSMVVEVTP